MSEIFWQTNNRQLLNIWHNLLLKFFNSQDVFLHKVSLLTKVTESYYEPLRIVVVFFYCYFSLSLNIWQPPSVGTADIWVYSAAVYSWKMSLHIHSQQAVWDI